MARRFAAALACAVFTLVCLPFLFELISEPAARPPAATASRPQIVGHVRPIGRREPFAAFAAIEPAPRAAEPPPANEAPVIVTAFDPDLYRSGRVGEPLSHAELCEIIEEVAAEHDIPLPLFARLIWQESRFRNETVSRAGAQGIAQFMPGTAAERGLDDPFDPLEALPASADFLRELIDQFGNFGLAAAAYNGGPNRVKRWLAGRARLPKETREYVLRITGRKAEHWARKARVAPHPDAFAVEDCKVTPIRAALEVPRRSRR